MKKNDLLLDCGLSNVRGIAVFLVIVIHCASQDFYTPSAHWWISAIIDSLSRPAVPLFLMLSGALLLRREEPTFYFLKKRILRIIPPLIFWGLVYVIFNALYWNVSISWLDLISVISKKPYIHLWYLYYVIGLYALIPIFSRWYTRASKKELAFYLMMWIFINFASKFRFALPTVGEYGFIPFLSLFGYIVMGAFIYDVMKSKPHNIRPYFQFVFYIISSALLAFGTWHMSKVYGYPSDKHLNYLNPLIMIQSAFLFSFIINSRIRVPNLASKFSLGIYCVHMMFIPMTFNFLSNFNMLYPIKISIAVLLVLFLSITVTFAMSKINALRPLV